MIWGGYLIVGLAGDEDAADGKRDPILKVEERAKVMAACRYVDEVIPNAPWRIDASWIAQHNIDIVHMATIVTHVGHLAIHDVFDKNRQQQMHCQQQQCQQNQNGPTNLGSTCHA